MERDRWDALFTRAADYDVSLEEVAAALGERRGDDD